MVGTESDKSEEKNTHNAFLCVVSAAKKIIIAIFFNLLKKGHNYE